MRKGEHEPVLTRRVLAIIFETFQGAITTTTTPFEKEAKPEMALEDSHVVERQGAPSLVDFHRTLTDEPFFFGF